MLLRLAFVIGGALFEILCYSRGDAGAVCLLYPCSHFAVPWPATLLMTRALCIIGIALTAFLHQVEHASAEEHAMARLTYDVAGSPGCPDEQAFRDIVAGRLGYDPFDGAASLSIDARITRRSDLLIGRVATIDANGAASGVRDIEGSIHDCLEVATAMAIAVNIVLDPFGLAAAREPEPPPPTPPPQIEERAPEPPQPEPPRVEETTEDEGPRVRFVMHGRLSVGYGLAPEFTLGPVFGAGVAIDEGAVFIQGRVDFMPIQATSESDDRLEATLFTAGPTGCFTFGVGVACAALQFGALQGRAFNVVNSITQTSFFVSAEVHAGVDIPFSDVFSFQALAELRVPLIRTALKIDGAPIWTAPPLAGGVTVGLGAAFE